MECNVTEKILCFLINDKELYLERILVEYDKIPIFFLCRNEDMRYLCLCYDIDNLRYYIVSVSTKNVFNLLHGKTPMRDIFLNRSKYWDISAGQESGKDVVKECPIADLDQDVLPNKNAYYEAPSEF